MSAAEPVPLIQTTGLRKQFGHVTALAGVDFRLDEGEVVALCGDNGAGKSTFVSLLSGVNEPDGGSIQIDGEQVWLTSPMRAQDLGIATVFQNLALVEQRDVASNLFLGREPMKWGVVVNRRKMVREATEVIRRLRVSLPSVKTAVRDLSGGQRQAVAVARAVLRGSRVLIMDEPTAALGVRESGRVIELIKELKANGLSIILISHNMDNVFEVSDRIVAFRLGRKVADISRDEIEKSDLVALLTGAVSDLEVKGNV